MLVFHYFNEVDTLKRTILKQLVSLFLGARHKWRNYAPRTWFHFLKSLTQGGNRALTDLHQNEQEGGASKSSTPDGRKTSWKSGPNAPST